MKRFTQVCVLMVVIALSACDRINSNSQPPAQLAILNLGDLEYTDKLLMQRARATRAHKKDAAKWLKASLKMADEDKASSFEKGYSGISKMHCPAAQVYPNNETLIICTESEVLSALNFEGGRGRFEGALGQYKALLKFSEDIDEPLSVQQRQSVETNISCLESFLAEANTSLPVCDLVFTILR